MKKILNRLREIIANKKESNYGYINKQNRNKIDSNKSAPTVKKNNSNKLKRNRWGFPTFLKSSK